MLPLIVSAIVAPAVIIAAWCFYYQRLWCSGHPSDGRNLFLMIWIVVNALTFSQIIASAHPSHLIAALVAGILVPPAVCNRLAPAIRRRYNK